MRKNLLLHKLKKLPAGVHGYAFNEWCVNLINRTFVNEDGSSALRRPLTPEDIDRAHILHTKRKNANVVLVQFMNMTLRNEVFFAKSVLKNLEDGYSISEHLTPDNIGLLNAAKDDGVKAWSSDCKIFVEKKGGGKRIIRSLADLKPRQESYHQSRMRRHENQKQGNGNVVNHYPLNAYYAPSSDFPYAPTNDHAGMHPNDPRSPAVIDYRNRGNFYHNNYNNNYNQPSHSRW